MDISLRKVSHVVIEELGAHVGAAIPPSGLPLVKLLARVEFDVARGTKQEQTHTDSPQYARG
jgi:hypothetical protein